MKYFIIAGEASGDLHGGNLVKQLRLKDADIEITGWGGNHMKLAGVNILKNISELAFMGFAEVLMNIGTILQNFSLCKKQLLEVNPDLVILIDYPGFNLRMAKWAKKKGFKVAYYISPTVWAWKENRVETIKKYVDRMICILPFEKAFYAMRNCEVDYVGNPTVDVIEEEKLKPNQLNYKNVIALLPGSRKQEIEKMLPLMLASVADFKDFKIVIAQAPNLDKNIYLPFLENTDIALIQHQTYNILKLAKLAIVTSGTATLETALFQVPQLVCYIANPISYAIAKQLVKVKYISLVNLILDRNAVVELIQNDVTVQNIQQEMKRLLFDETRIQGLKKDYEALKNILHEGNASEKTAEIMYQLVLKQ